MKILTIARELWSQAGRPPRRLKEFWKTAEQQFAAGCNAPADHLITKETPLPIRSAAD